MAGVAQAVAMRERIVTFGEDGGLVGVLTLPAEIEPDTPFVVLINSGIVHRVGAHRSHVTFARTFAAARLPALRFDLSGIGDSERRSSAASLQEAVHQDIAAALDFLAAKHGATRFALVGLCSGAFDAFEYAQSDPRVVGAGMLDMPGPFRNWSHFAYRAAARARRVVNLATLLKKLARIGADPTRGQLNGAVRGDFLPGVRGSMSRECMESGLDTLLARGVRLVFLFTGGVEDNYNHRHQFRLRFPRAAAHPLLSTEYVPWSDHTFSTKSARQYVSRYLTDWIAQLRG